MNYGEVGGILKVISHPVRLKILRGLLSDECSVGDIVKKLGLPQSTVSQHLALLRTGGVIVPQKEGVRTCYRVVDQRVKEVIKIFG